MTSETNISQQWDDIVFERRNQTYGAYLLRKRYSRHVIIAAGLTTILVASVLAYPSLQRIFHKEETVKKSELKTVRYTDLAPPPPINKNTPPPPKVKIPEVKEVIKFLPPKVTEKDVVEEEPMLSQEEAKQVDTGAEAAEGTGEVIFDEPVQGLVVEAEDEDKVFTVVEQQAEYEGGLEAMYRFIAKNVRYPSNSKRMGVQGSVFISFVVDRDGTLSSVEVIKSLHTELDKEALRVVKMMPPWKPAKQNGKSVRSRFVLPIKFKLDG